MKDGKEMADAFGDFVNNFSCPTEDFINSFCGQHRTLQQSGIRVLLQLIEHVASDEYRHDGRNEGSHNICKDIMEGFKLKMIKNEMRMGRSEEEAEKYASAEYCKPSRFLGFI